MDKEKYTQNEIDLLLTKEELKRRCTHENKVQMPYGFGHLLIHCKDCGHMHVEAKKEAK